MRTRNPIQAKSTEQALRAVLPESFKMVNDKSSNGYKYMNLLFGVEADQAKLFFQEVYSNSFFPTMDFGVSDTLYEVYLSGITNQQYLNTTVSGIPIKIVSSTSPGGDAEFWQGDPTRLVYLTNKDIGSGLIASGRIIGLNYFRLTPSGNGYFLINTDIDQGEYYSYRDTGSSSWKLDLNTTGLITNTSGYWPGVFTQSYEVAGVDEVLTPKGSGYLSSHYPLTRRVLDDSGVYWNIDAYEPYHGWVRDPYWSVVAKVDYPGDYFYDGDGEKCYFRVALNNPYGSGNYATEYLPLQHIPISGTLKVYDIDILDTSGNATEIPSAGKTLYSLQSNLLLTGSGKFDPIYVGYDSTVPDTYTFGAIAGSGANVLLTTSWEYQREGSHLDEGSHQWVEGSGRITNLIKITNPYSRYLVEYKYKEFDEAKYITSLEASRYVSFDTLNPIYTTKATGILEQIPYEFTRDPSYASEKARYLTFDGWEIRPNSRLTLVDFNLPVFVGEGDATLGSFQTRKEYIGYSPDFVPIYYPSRTTVLYCPFDNAVSLGTCTEDDLSGSGNTLEWYDDSGNSLWRIAIDGAYGKATRYIGGSGYFYKDGVDFMKDATSFLFEFRLHTKADATLMVLSQATDNRYIKVDVQKNGMIYITSNGNDIQCRYRFAFDNKMKGLLIKAYKDENFTSGLNYKIYVKDTDFWEKQTFFIRDTTETTISPTYLHVLQNATMDMKSFKIWHEAL